MIKVCLDLTVNEMRDRHGGFGRYALRLLEQYAQLEDTYRGEIEFYGLPWSSEPPLPLSQIETSQILARPEIKPWRHRWQRRLISGLQLRSSKMDVFHALYPSSMPWLPGCALVVTVHDLIPLVLPEATSWPLDQWRRLRQEHFRCRRAKQLIAISSTTKQDLIETLKLPAENIAVVHHGVDLQRFTALASSSEEKARLQNKYHLPASYFIYVGSDHYRKNHQRLWEAWQQCASKIGEGLVFVGRPLYQDTLPKLEQEAKRLGLSERFRWLKNIDDDELPALYRGATALVTPSLYEGFGLTVLEAMACGAPVGAADNRAYREVGGEDALYFDPLSTKQMAEQLWRLASDATLRQSLSDRGLKRAARFTWRRAAEATIEVYRLAASILDK